MNETKKSAKALSDCLKDKYRNYSLIRFFIVLLSVALSYVFMFKSIGCYYMTNDDPYMMRNISGYFTGHPSSYDVFVSTPLGWLYLLFYKLFPDVSWYSLFHIGSNVLCASVILFLLLEQISVKSLWKRVCCTLIVIFFTAAEMAMPFQNINFSITAALYGLAAVIILLSLAESDVNRSYIIKYAVCMAFLFLSQSIRSSTYKALLPFFAFVFVYVTVKSIGRWNKRFSAVIIFATSVLIALISGFGTFDKYYKDNVVESVSYSDIKSLRGEYMDYVNLPYEQNAEFYDSIGWDETLYKITKRQMYLDERFNADALAKIVEKDKKNYSESSFLSRAKKACKCFMGKSASDTITYEPIDMPQLIDTKKFVAIGLLMVFLCTSAALFWGIIKKKTFSSQMFLLAGVNGIAVAEVVYLCYLGRFILRAFACAAFPALTVDCFVLVKEYPQIIQLLRRLVYELKLPGIPRTEKNRKTLPLRASSLILVMCLAVSFFAMTFIFKNTFSSDFRNIKEKQIAASEAVEAYCVSHPDRFYLHNGPAINKSVFLDMKKQRGNGRNILFWGGAEVFTKSHYDAIGAFGFDSFYTENLLDDNVYFISDYPLMANPEFLLYMYSAYGDDVKCKRTDVINNNIFVYKFFRQQPEQQPEQQPDNKQ